MQDQATEAEPSFWPTPAGAAKPTAAAKPAAAPKRAPVEPSAVRLEDLCEPIFQYVCKLNRSARQQRAVNAAQVRTDVKALLADARNRASAGGYTAGGPSLLEQWNQVEGPLLFFIDFTIRSSALPFASRWDDLARELKREMSGDEKFFDLLETALADRTDAGAERVAVFYKCMGLGFTGFYTGQPEFLRRKMLDCSTHIRGMIDANAGGKVCPEAYENVNVADLIESPGKSVVGVVIALVGLTIVLFVANAWWYHNSVQRLGAEVDGLTRSVHTPVQTNPSRDH